MRALLPHPVATPTALARLQIAGLDLPREPDPLREPSVDTGDSVASDASPVLTIAVAPDLTLTTGKACAQVGHAGQLALLGQWHRLRADEGRVALVLDGGFTEVAPGTATCAATFDPLS